MIFSRIFMQKMYVTTACPMANHHVMINIWTPRKFTTSTSMLTVDG